MSKQRIDSLGQPIIWEGVYKNFSEAPQHQADIFNSTTYVDRILPKVEKALVKLHTENIIDTPLVHDYVLPITAAFAAINKKTLRILDFGGGAGISFIEVIGTLKPCLALQYDIVETPAVCDAVAPLFKHEKRITFLKSLPKPSYRYDLIHIGSALQYIEDWRSLLAQLTVYRSRYILMSDLNAGDIPSYVTIQNYYGARIPVHFWNVKEIGDVMHSLGYRETFRTRFRGTYFGQRQKRPMDAIPKEKRIVDGYHLLYSRPSNTSMTENI